jgi:hypothetical protein
VVGFEGIGDFDSDDPWQRYIAHQAAKGDWPTRGEAARRRDMEARACTVEDVDESAGMSAQNLAKDFQSGSDDDGE